MKTHLELAKLFKEIDQWDTIGTDTQYRILEYPDEVVIIFCPSNSKADWKINFSFPKKLQEDGNSVLRPRRLSQRMERYPRPLPQVCTNL